MIVITRLACATLGTAICSYKAQRMPTLLGLCLIGYVRVADMFSSNKADTEVIQRSYNSQSHHFLRCGGLWEMFNFSGIYFFMGENGNNINIHFIRLVRTAIRVSSLLMSQVSKAELL